MRPLAPWLRWWLRDPAEAGAFRLAAVYMRRDKDVRHRLYPSLAMVIVFPLYFLFSSRASHGESVFYVYMCLWMLATLPLSTTETLRLSQDWQAADLFYYAPLEGHGPLFHGVRKAALYYATLPCAVLLMVMLALVAPDPVATFRNAIPMLILLPSFSLRGGMSREYLPLARPPRTGEQSRGTQGPILLMMFLLPFFMGAIYLLIRAIGYWPLLAIEVPLTILIHRMILRSMRRARPICAD